MQMLIVGLLKNDDDGEMAEMTDALEAKYRREGHAVTRRDYNTLPERDQANGTQVLVICGHSRAFYDWKCVDVSQRLVGGFALDETTEWILGMVGSGVKEVWIWCCEAGLSARNRGWKWRNGGECAMRFTGRWYDTLTTETGLRRSVVDHVACAIWEKEVVAKPKKGYRIAREIVVKGFYNVGYIDKDGTIETFDQSVLSSANRIREIKRLDPQGKKFSQELRRETNKLETNIKTKQRPDVVSWRLVLGGYENTTVQGGDDNGNS